MDKIDKALQKLSAAERKKIKDIFTKILAGKLNDLDIKKLTGYSNIFRVRSGRVRIVYTEDKKGKKSIVKIDRRNEKTYKI